MAGLDPAIHVFSCSVDTKTWMPGTRPGMTENNDSLAEISLHQKSNFTCAIKPESTVHSCAENYFA
jgi:hypothetical protein